MAAKTQLLAKVIEEALNDESTLYAQLQDFQEVLLPTMDNAQFADMYAQTIAYGMFVARLQDNSVADFTRQQAANFIPKTNPFLRKLFQYIAGYDIDENIRWIVDSLADMFNYVDIDAIHREFISKDKDPFLHFYEDFLTRYDKNLKNAKGAYYTPAAVVKFIVNAVDDILKTDFNLAKGLADNSMVNINDQEYHKIQILDPATGTGTFLAEVVRKIYQKFANNAGVWDDYVRRHLIPRLNGFEIMMSPYTMAHLKIETILQEFGHNADDNQRLRIYLTDSLEEPKQSVQRLGLYKWLSDESAEAQKIKNDMPVMVVLGNPPYNGDSKNKGKWIMDLMGEYKKGLQERNLVPLDNDYVKFIRFGEYYINKNKTGILAYICANSFLDGVTHKLMRNKLMKSFNRIYVLNLHGDSTKQEKCPDGSLDQNVFDIKTGVSINMFVKTTDDSSPSKLYYADLYGKQNYKYDYLLNNGLSTIKWSELDMKNNMIWRLTDFSSSNEYENYINIVNLFLRTTPCIRTHNDTELVAFTPYNSPYNQKYLFKVFDYRYVDFDLSKIGRSRIKVMKEFIGKNNIGLIFQRGYSGEMPNTPFITCILSDQGTIRPGTTSTSNVAPLYLYPEQSDLLNTVRSPNLNPEIVRKIAEAIGQEFEVEKSSVANKFAPVDILDYIYAILHSPSYREKYKVFLKIDFPRIPYPENAEQFNKLAVLGEKLKKLHLMENIAVADTMANFPKLGSNKIENFFTEKSGDYQDNKVWINDSQYFDNVPEISWSFYIGGYQPAQKWLKDRKGRTLTYEDIEHYQKIIFVLNETDKIMKEIDLTL
jgi:predicted helicase